MAVVVVDYLFFFFCISIILNAQNYYYPEKNENWKELNPAVFGIDEKLIDSAVDFALSNEYSGNTDLRVAILKGFSREPFHKILGPTKKRGGPRKGCENANKNNKPI